MDPGARVDQEDQEDRRDQQRQLNALGNQEVPGDLEDLAGREVQVDQQLDGQENQGDQVDLVDRGDREVLMAREDRQQKRQELQVRNEQDVKITLMTKGIHYGKKQPEVSETERFKSTKDKLAVQAVVA